MTRTALIGHTGFVGGTLDRAGTFSDRFNSATVDGLRGGAFELIVCAGVSAVKYLANRDPAADRAGIARLTDALAAARTREFVLVSTVDVYGDPVGGDEDTLPRPDHAYGENRLALERWVAERFETVRIVRLPALFGPGLRKNALYDLLHDNMVGNINPAGVFQWYPVERLWSDIAILRAADLRLVNLATAPLAMARVIDMFFAGAPVGPAREPAPRYDLRTKHAARFGGRDGHVMDAAAVLAAMARFVALARG